MKTLIYNVENSVGYITLNVPEKLNALCNDMKDELCALFRQIKNDPEVRAVVITGAGRAFCAGGDVTTMGAALKNNDSREKMLYNTEWFRELVKLEKPVIAAVNGFAFGGGLSISLACDFIYCSEKGSFCCSQRNIGLVPDLACMWNLPKRVGSAKAKDICYTGRRVKADEALAIGLADKVVAPEELMSEAKAFAEELAKGPTYSIGLMKALYNRAYDCTYDQFADVEEAYQCAAMRTEDHIEQVRAFLAKEKSDFIGR